MTDRRNQNDEEGAVITPDLSVSLDQVLSIEAGEVIAIRATHDGVDDLVSGRVESTFGPYRNPKVTLTERLVDQESVELVSINAELWWGITDDEITDRSAVISHQEEIVSPSGSSRGPPTCGLYYIKGEGIKLIVPTPVYSAGRPKYYTELSFDGVVSMISGQIIDPAQLLPDTHSSP